MRQASLTSARGSADRLAHDLLSGVKAAPPAFETGPMPSLLVAVGLGTLGVYLVVTLAVAATTLRSVGSRPAVGRSWRGDRPVDVREQRAA